MMPQEDDGQRHSSVVDHNNPQRDAPQYAAPGADTLPYPAFLAAGPRSSNYANRAVDNASIFPPRETGNLPPSESRAPMHSDSHFPSTDTGTMHPPPVAFRTQSLLPAAQTRFDTAGRRVLSQYHGTLATEHSRYPSSLNENVLGKRTARGPSFSFGVPSSHARLGPSSQSYISLGKRKTPESIQTRHPRIEPAGYTAQAFRNSRETGREPSRESPHVPDIVEDRTNAFLYRPKRTKLSVKSLISHPVQDNSPPGPSISEQTSRTPNYISFSPNHRDPQRHAQPNRTQPHVPVNPVMRENTLQTEATNQNQTESSHAFHLSRPSWDPYQGKLHQSQHLNSRQEPINSEQTGSTMYVNNFWQNVYIPPTKQTPHTPQNPGPQRSLLNGNRGLPRIAMAPIEAGQSHNPRGRIYDLARIRQLGFVIQRGRVFNQQNHPICAAPRENGIPCKRNVSRSPCRWHGEVVVLTQLNTKNGLLDNLGNLIRVGNMRNASKRGTNRNQVGHNVPLSETFTPPSLVSRSLRWNNEEHYWFLLGLRKYGNKWSIIAKVVGTRNTLQVQSHAQKYFERQHKEIKKKSTIHDLKLESDDMLAIAAKYPEEETARRLNVPGAPGSQAGPSSHRGI